MSDHRNFGWWKDLSFFNRSWLCLLAAVLCGMLVFRENRLLETASLLLSALGLWWAGRAWSRRQNRLLSAFALLGNVANAAGVCLHWLR